MTCFVCQQLEREFAAKRRQYIEARSAVYYKVNTALAASKNVEMQRAKTDLEEHQLVCTDVLTTFTTIQSVINSR